MTPKKRRPRSEVQKFVTRLEEEMPPDAEWTLGGSWRRNAPDIGDLDIMLVTYNGLFNDFKFPYSFTRTRSGPQVVNGIYYIEGDATEPIRMDFWSCTPTQVPAFLMFITGPAALNIAQRAQAQKLGFTLSQYGLFDRTGKLIPVKSEQALYQRLGLGWLEPEERQRYVEKAPDTEAEWRAWNVPSSSGSDTYQVRCRGEYWECSCLGFKYCRTVPRECKHIKAKKKELASGSPRAS